MIDTVGPHSCGLTVVVCFFVFKLILLFRLWPVPALRQSFPDSRNQILSPSWSVFDTEAAHTPVRREAFYD